MRNIHIDYKKLAIDNLPRVLQTPFVIRFLHLVLQQLVYLHSETRKHKEKTDYVIEHTGQVCYLRGMLNDHFDPIHRRISIGEGERRKYLYLYARDSARFQMLFKREIETPKVVYRRGVSSGSGCDFTVHVPAELRLSNADELRMRALLNEYKLASKQYVINYI